ncbi:hypothetical protein ABIA33_007422 [Streptacidiphilus sp. MAP12-16]|uniref:hypothetical protein n=1 Tax=Streptacidiphilus sp. MAP12-16 TaxID=3156300 RepID=UPI0035131ED2
MPTASATEQPSSAQAQAAAVDQLLGQAANSRQQVENAVTAVEQCADSPSVSSAQSVLIRAALDRQSLVAELGSLNVSQLQGGAPAMLTLSRAWSESAAADSAYARWAGAMADGRCTAGSSPHTADWDEGLAESGKASADKNAFVVAWDPIAVRYNLPTRSADAI